MGKNRYDNAIATSMMLFFFNIPEKGCISGKNIPPLSIRMGAEGDSNSAFPDSGRLLVRIGASWWGSGPCSSLVEIGPLPMTTRNLWRSTLLRALIGLRRFATATMGAQAQTYYYYPSSATPVYYSPAGYRPQTVWYRYPVQYYQPAYSSPAYQVTYTPQYYQTAYSQPATQTASSDQPATVAAAPVTQTSDANNQAVQATEATAPAGDPYGFTNWLNATRAAYGLPAVGYDPNLSSWAAMNNNQQASHGIGHFVMGTAPRQNSAMGGFPGVESMWMVSPAHRAALLDPTIRWIGIAGLCAYWTFNAN